MSRRLLTLRGDMVLNALWDGRRILEISADVRKQGILNRIYVARVDNIVENIGGAFLSVGDMKLFFPLKENPLPIFTVCQRIGRVSAGDEIVVQVVREAMKTKLACAGAKLSMAGRYCVVTLDARPGCSVHLSKKVTDEEIRQRIMDETSSLKCIKTLSETAGQKGFGLGVIVRTNAAEVEIESVKAEIRLCCSELVRIIQTAACRSAGCCLWKPLPSYISSVRDTALAGLESVVCDDEGLLEEVKQALEENGCDEGIKFSLYNDTQYPLSKCYGLDSAIEKAKNRIVWLPSGAYIVIEQTEALTAIDVNTGKAIESKGKNESQAGYFYRINMEAAKEIMYQLRLRNLSGMIIVDFINMHDEKLDNSLLEQLKEMACTDPVHTKIVDMTPLGLVEITRKKVKESLIL